MVVVVWRFCSIPTFVIERIVCFVKSDFSSFDRLLSLSFSLAESYILRRVKDLATAEHFLDIIANFKTRLAWHGQSAESNPSGGNNFRGLYNIALKSLGWCFFFFFCFFFVCVCVCMCVCMCVSRVLILFDCLVLKAC